MQPGQIQDALFKRRPRLVTLAAARQAAADEYTELRYKERITGKPATGRDEPMDLSALEESPEMLVAETITIREQLANHRKEVNKMKSELDKCCKALESLRSEKSQQSKFPQGLNPKAAPFTPGKKPPPKPDGTAGSCYYCDVKGHISRDCRKKAKDIREGNFKPTPRRGPSGEILPNQPQNGQGNM